MSRRWYLFFFYVDTASSIGSDVSDMYSSESRDTEDYASFSTSSADDSQSTGTFETSSVSEEDFMSVGTSQSDDGRSETPSVSRMDFACEGSSDSAEGAEFSRESGVPSDMYDEESGGMYGRAMMNHWILIKLASFYAL